MGAHVIIVLFALAQANATAPPAAPPVPPKAMPASGAIAPPQSPATPEARCDARPWQRLVGRTISDLLTIQLPPNTRIYRLDDPPAASVVPGRLTVELNRNTRVRRVYCS
jgi:hypothetical protein